MTTKQQVIAASSIAILAFAIGRYSAPARVISENKSSISDQKSDSKAQDVQKDTHKKTTVVETKKPDGELQIVTTVTEDTSSKKTNKSNDIDMDIKQSDNKKDVKKETSKLRIYGLAGINASRPQDGMLYGLGISRNILGPISVGLWGLNNGTLGCSIGLEF